MLFNHFVKPFLLNALFFSYFSIYYLSLKIISFFRTWTCPKLLFNLFLISCIVIVLYYEFSGIMHEYEGIVLQTKIERRFNLEQNWKVKDENLSLLVSLNSGYSFEALHLKSISASQIDWEGALSSIMIAKLERRVVISIKMTEGFS